ncbi:MAG: hypothetical protein D6758_03325 [Gammaproteobacteria bacterium]|nr:MAG: hypothetical protein D6758_03325 [Gammaproteobacteria bacterium]
MDWTAPGDRLRSSVSEGSGRQVEDAIAGAFAQWEENARYDEGYIAWQFNARDVGGPVSVTQGRFETDGATVWDTLSSVTGWASVGLALGGLALSALIPPAAPAVTAMVWGSIFTGATASVVNLAQNYNEGYRDWRSNGLDVLSLVSLGAAGVWARGAKIALTGGQTAMRNAGMFGQLTADGWQGVIMADDLLDEWEAVNADPSLSPDERLDKLVQLARNAVLAGTLLSLSFKGTARDLKALKAGEFDPAHLKRLNDPKAHLTEADAQPVRQLKAGETEKTLTLQPHPEEPDALVREKVEPETVARDKAIQASIAAKQFRPKTFREAIERLLWRRQQIREKGFVEKYTDAEKTWLAEHGDVASEQIHVRLMPARYLKHRDTGEALGGMMGATFEGTTGKGAKYWSTTLDQIEDADTDPKLLCEKLGLEYNPDEEYVLILIDSRKAADMAGTASVAATFRHVSEFANRELPDTLPKTVTDEIMTPAFQEKYGRIHAEAMASRRMESETDVKNFVRYLESRGLEQREIDLLISRMQMHDKIGNNQYYTGNGLTLNRIAGSDSQYGAVETLNFERREINLKTFLEAEAIEILEIKPL